MKSIDMLSLWNCEKIVSFYNLQLLEGEMVKPTETNKIMINESAVKALGMSEPIGKKLYLDNRAWTITGIIKDFPHHSSNRTGTALYSNYRRYS